MNPISNCAQSSESVFEMKRLLILPFIAYLCACESNYVPSVTSQMATAGKEQHDVATLQQGRTLLVHRCIECHTLPPLWHYSSEDWPGIVNTMAHRAGLTRAERDAIVAYILAARSQK
jgi:hypothetical protein